MIRHTTALIMIACMLLSACGTKDESTSEHVGSSSGSITPTQEQQNESNANDTVETQTTDSPSSTPTSTDAHSDQESLDDEEISSTEKEDTGESSGSQATENPIEKSTT